MYAAPMEHYRMRVGFPDALAGPRREAVRAADPFPPTRTIELVTPDVAAAWLKCRSPADRFGIVRNTVQNYGHAMTAGEWNTAMTAGRSNRFRQ